MKKIIIPIVFSFLNGSIDNTFILLEPIAESSNTLLYYQFLNESDTTKNVVMTLPNDGADLTVIDYNGIMPEESDLSVMKFDIVESSAFIRFSIPVDITDNYISQFNYDFEINKPVDNIAIAIAEPSNSDKFYTNLNNVEDNMPPESGVDRKMYYDRRNNLSENQTFKIFFSYENLLLKKIFLGKQSKVNQDQRIKYITNKYMLSILSLVILISIISIFQKKIIEAKNRKRNPNVK